MSYSYTLALRTTLSAKEAVHLVSGMSGFERQEGRSIVGPGIVVSIRTADAEDKEDGLQFESFEPDLCVSLTHKRGNKDEDMEISNVIQVTMLLLHHATGEAVLRAEDALWLRFEHGVVIFNQEEDLWREGQDTLPLVTLPYQVAILPDATLTPS